MESNNYLIIIFTFLAFLACGDPENADTTRVNFKSGPNPPETYKVSPDELLIGLAEETNTNSQTLQQRPEVKLAASPEMAILFDYLEMSMEQHMLFERHYHYQINTNAEVGPHYLDQAEMQFILDEIFENILTEDQFAHYMDWKRTD